MRVPPEPIQSSVHVPHHHHPPAQHPHHATATGHAPPANVEALVAQIQREFPGAAVRVTGRGLYGPPTGRAHGGPSAWQPAPVPPDLSTGPSHNRDGSLGEHNTLRHRRRTWQPPLSTSSTAHASMAPWSATTSPTGRATSASRQAGTPCVIPCDIDCANSVLMSLMNMTPWEDRTGMSTTELTRRRRAFVGTVAIAVIVAVSAANAQEKPTEAWWLTATFRPTETKVRGVDRGRDRSELRESERSQLRITSERSSRGSELDASGWVPVHSDKRVSPQPTG